MKNLRFNDYLELMANANSEEENITIKLSLKTISIR